MNQQMTAYVSSINCTQRVQILVRSVLTIITISTHEIILQAYINCSLNITK